MNDFNSLIQSYLDYCRYQKRLDTKTIKAYRTDLAQFAAEMPPMQPSEISPQILEQFIAGLHANYKPKSVKRKIASVKAFFHYLEYKDLIAANPFGKIQVRFREPIILPKTIPLNVVETLLSVMYQQYHQAQSGAAPKKRRCREILRDIAVIELLFATGMRISELCSLTDADINLYERSILIYGKGAKERRLQIGNDDVVGVLSEYRREFSEAIQNCGHFFVNNLGSPLSDQTVRRIINKYTALAAINLHITPHMFRHTFATSLLEADVDIRYIQEMLGHSSINITQIYTHVALSKQRDILTAKHPRKNFKLG